MQHFFVLTGAMGSGKSTVCQYLESGSLNIVAEPARQILMEQRCFDGRGIPSHDPQLFTDLMLSRALYGYNQNRHTDGGVLFDRGVPDMIAYAELFRLDTSAFERAARVYRYNPTVFVMQDWAEIYTTDSERTMTYEQARDFGRSVRDVYRRLDYDLVEVPRVSVEDRSVFIAEQIQMRL